MASINLSMHSITEGMFTYSNLDIRYTSDFLVSTNPSITGNLSNVLNQQMTAGTGTFDALLTFNTTADGEIILFTPALLIDGAPNMALPPTPILSLVDAQPDRIVIEWQPITEFGDDFLDFVVYRSPADKMLTLQSAYANTLSNNTIDTAVQPGQSWTYWVQSVHSFGVTSNLSSPLTVDVPYPVPKSFLPNLTAVDIPGDTGGAMNVSWSPGDASIVEHHVFVLTSDFSDVSDQTTTITAAPTSPRLKFRRTAAVHRSLMASPTTSLPLDWTSTATLPPTSGHRTGLHTQRHGAANDAGRNSHRFHAG